MSSQKEKTCGIGFRRRLLPIAAALVVAYMLAAAPVSPAAPGTEIAPGNIITLQNWRRYRSLMSEGLIALFEGRH
ncbi:MAG TPA: hypothetical protein VJN94_10950, partial [Candidatus Binataceae bacterium]|nr:hypothetical protein [Candidatus Binataceae bacterium]